MCCFVGGGVWGRKSETNLLPQLPICNHLSRRMPPRPSYPHCFFFWTVSPTACLFIFTLVGASLCFMHVAAHPGYRIIPKKKIPNNDVGGWRKKSVQKVTSSTYNDTYARLTPSWGPGKLFRVSPPNSQPS